MLANAQSKVMKTSPSFIKKTGDQRVSGKEWRASGKNPDTGTVAILQRNTVPSKWA